MWDAATFQSAGQFEPVQREGYIYGGLALYLVMSGSPKGRRPPTWCLVHLNSGHAVAWIDGAVAVSFPIASEIADCADWSFEGLAGWRNVDPELPAKVLAVLARHPKATRTRGGGGNEEVARAIASSRAA